MLSERELKESVRLLMQQFSWLKKEEKKAKATKNQAILEMKDIVSSLDRLNNN